MTIYTVDTKLLNTAAKIKEARQTANQILEEAVRAEERIRRQKDKARGFRKTYADQVRKGQTVIHGGKKCLVMSNKRGGWRSGSLARLPLANGDFRLIVLKNENKTFEIRPNSDSLLKVVIE